MNAQFDDTEREPILGASDNGALDWESFKKRYYSQEQQIKSALEALTKQHGETSKKLAMLDDSDGDQEHRRRFQQIDLEKVKEQLAAVNDLMSQMKQLLGTIQINPEEPQLKLKQNILKRFREIHEEHEKELRRIRDPFEYNVRKYDLFKESLSKERTLLQRSRYDRDDVKHNRALRRSIDQSDSVIEMARQIHGSFVSQGERLGNIQSRVSDIIGGFTDINTTIRSIRNLKVRNQLLLLILVVLLVVFMLKKLLLG